jgi:hypothetical protein
MNMIKKVKLNIMSNNGLNEHKNGTMVSTITNNVNPTSIFFITESPTSLQTSFRLPQLDKNWLYSTSNKCIHTNFFLGSKFHIIA